VATTPLQGVVKSYDPISGDGTIVSDTTLDEYELSRTALEGSVFRMLRQGQRVVFELDDQNLAVGLHMGSERDMGTPGYPQPHAGSSQHPQGGSEG
jgi:CspA family cold shock protein